MPKCQYNSCSELTTHNLSRTMCYDTFSKIQKDVQCFLQRPFIWHMQTSDQFSLSIYSIYDCLLILFCIIENKGRIHAIDVLICLPCTAGIDLDVYLSFLQLEDELSNLLGDQNQIATSKQALELTRLMVKADTSDDRSTLLKILRVSFSTFFA